ncbi:MAG: hypothetical protein A2293_15420 [Elusimicrobia bacterium RIFOXYB2_FULL_49_7]|nr:MAG: hypothetical protein A2293_15420 [Elusimicrobia bacterium RIFOXYB2_FULL_49_7]
MADNNQSPPLQEPQPGNDQRKLYSLVAYIPFLCFISLFGKDSDEFTRAHGRQGLLLMAVEILALTLLYVGKLVWVALLLACLIFSVVGLMTALSGRQFEIPFIGKWADRLK